MQRCPGVRLSQAECAFECVYTYLSGCVRDPWSFETEIIYPRLSSLWRQERRERQADRQADKQADRQTDRGDARIKRQRHRLIQRETYRHIDKHSNIRSDI